MAAEYREGMLDTVVQHDVLPPGYVTVLGEAYHVLDDEDGTALTAARQRTVDEFHRVLRTHTPEIHADADTARYALTDDGLTAAFYYHLEMDAAAQEYARVLDETERQHEDDMERLRRLMTGIRGGAGRVTSSGIGYLAATELLHTDPETGMLAALAAFGSDHTARWALRRRNDDRMASRRDQERGAAVERVTTAYEQFIADDTTAST